MLASLAVREDLFARLDEEFDQEFVEVAFNLVRKRVEPTNWAAFQSTASEFVAGAEAAERTGLKSTNVPVARSRIQQMLKEQIRALESDE